jgi:acyl carrier protein
MNLEKAVRRLLGDSNLLGAAANSVPADDNLFELIDSMQMLRIVANVEKTFRIEIDDFEMLPDNLRTVSALVALLERKLAPSVRASA